MGVFARGVLIGAVAAGCGGTGSSHATLDAGAGGPDAGRANGGATVDSGAPPLDCPGEPPLVCAWNCDGDALRTEAICSRGEWVCADGRHDVTGCAENPCLGRQLECCRGETVELSLCVNRDSVCPAGTELKDPLRPCGGCEVTGCGPGHHCSHPRCRKTQGVCQPTPGSCDAAGAPVCTCDGTMAANACEAARAGQDLGEDCPIAETQFFCGSRICEKGTEYCRLDATADGRYPACAPMPAGCDPTESCTCLIPPGMSCECGTSDGPFIYCFGG